ncbi:uncharacterized protein LOC112556150 isoform X2 [Pomacea canaliculata]|uniref:uncharacterized protein LOC112556150 isoform X2 n=1 Tax=Pomacea canaliculata TaxID=400727 RepID=UPI000D73AD07|nr:uncharacterized protein LOC112556150 isoform X2 [Pomacea canaliculata]
MNNADDRWNDVNISRSGPEFRYYQKVIPTGPQDVTLKELANASPCYDGHLYLNNTCLEVVPDPPVFVNWSQARSICSQKFGRLAVLDSPILESILSKLPNFGLKKNYYIDIVRRSDGVLIWGATGGVCSLQRPPWYNGQPDNYKLGSAPENCGNIEDTATSYRYLDVPCNLSRGYICQYAPWVHYVW